MLFVASGVHSVKNCLGEQRVKLPGTLSLVVVAFVRSWRLIIVGCIRRFNWRSCLYQAAQKGAVS